MTRCQHGQCQCEGVASFDGYCSSYCAEMDRKAGASTAGERGCGCGHPPCGDTRR